MPANHEHGAFTKCKCAICGKEFYIMFSGEYVYKAYAGKRPRFMCSWSCYREYLRQHPKRIKKALQPRPEDFLDDEE